jgi:hypothetical protein
MLSEKETNRVLSRFRREREFFSRRMGGLRREREQTLEEAHTASEFVFNIARMLALRTLPAAVETSIERDTGKRSNQCTVYLKLEGQAIGYFWIDPGDWLWPYGVSGKYCHFFRNALKKFGDLLVRKEAYRQSLMGRLARVQRMVLVEFAGQLESGQLRLETGYKADSGWAVGQDFCYLRFYHGDWRRTLCAFNDRYTWGAEFTSEHQVFMREDEVVLQVRRVLQALTGQPPASED